MTSHIREQIDFLYTLRLPDRFEPLFELVGDGLARILVPPTTNQKIALESIIDHVRASRQGCLLPRSGPSGAGKTTFANSATQWFARDIAPTVTYSGAIDYDALKTAVDTARQSQSANDSRIIPINIDHRESDPPNSTELATIKRFLRISPSGCKNIVFWPETDQTIAGLIGNQYKSIAGVQPHQILNILGPDVNTWKEIAVSTLKLANNFDSLEKIGVDPATYNPLEYPSLGEFLRTIQTDFNGLLRDLRASVSKAIVLLIVFISESSDPGVLNFINNSGRHGVIDARGLLSSTPDSEVGKWWNQRQGLLVRAIVQLNAHALFLSPPIVMSALRNFGPASDDFFNNTGLERSGPARGVRDLGRADVARAIRGEVLPRYEGRGNPADDAVAAFQLLAEKGFNLGADKKLNATMADGWQALLKTQGVDVEAVYSENSSKLLSWHHTR